MSRSTLDIRWVTHRYANGVVNAWHSYAPVSSGGLFSLGAFDGAECVGVVIVNRPRARMLDDGRTAEVGRLATNGREHAASALLGRARRVVQAMGFQRLVSYTLATEDGTCFKAAGWKPAAAVGGGKWSRDLPGRGGRRDANVSAQEKIRWEVPL